MNLIKKILVAKATALFILTGAAVDNGEMAYAKEVKATPDAPDRYVKARHDYKYEYAPGLMMLLPRDSSPLARCVFRARSARQPKHRQRARQVQHPLQLLVVAVKKLST